MVEISIELGHQWRLCLDCGHFDGGDVCKARHSCATNNGDCAAWRLKACRLCAHEPTCIGRSEALVRSCASFEFAEAHRT